MICLLISWSSELLDVPLDVWSQQQRRRNKALMSQLEGDLDPLIGQSYGLIYPSSTAAHSPTSCDLAHCRHFLKMSSKPVYNSYINNSSYFLHKQTDRSILITSSVEVIRVHLCRVTGRNKLCSGHQSNTGHTLITHPEGLFRVSVLMFRSSDCGGKPEYTVKTHPALGGHADSRTASELNPEPS